jgi:hypothetical protein
VVLLEVLVQDHLLAVALAALLTLVLAVLRLVSAVLQLILAVAVNHLSWFLALTFFVPV